MVRDLSEVCLKDGKAQLLLPQEQEVCLQSLPENLQGFNKLEDSHEKREWDGGEKEVQPMLQVLHQSTRPHPGGAQKAAEALSAEKFKMFDLLSMDREGRL